MPCLGWLLCRPPQPAQSTQVRRPSQTLQRTGQLSTDITWPVAAESSSAVPHSSTAQAESNSLQRLLEQMPTVPHVKTAAQVAPSRGAASESHRAAGPAGVSRG